MGPAGLEQGLLDPGAALGELELGQNPAIGVLPRAAVHQLHGLAQDELRQGLARLIGERIGALGRLHARQPHDLAALENDGVARPHLGHHARGTGRQLVDARAVATG